MGGGIYLIRDDGELVEMNERGYDTEDLLQELLAKYPNLLAGDRVDGATPRRWLLVSREVSLASEENGAGRWSVDHLFLDQDAIPTIVEVKRSTDTRIRREVIGQMLDYAANGVVYWSVERLRARFEESREAPEQDLAAFVGDPNADPDDFWQEVKRNLQAGRVRLVFVSDKTPDELRRIVEFLNEQMNPAEVLAVEVKQYVNEDSTFRTLVPRVLGQTVKAQDVKSAGRSARRKWDETSFFEDLKNRRGVEASVVAKRILDWAQREATYVWWGEGKTEGSFVPMLQHRGTKHQLFAVYTGGQFYLYFQHYQYKPPFEAEEKRLQLLKRLNSIPGISLPEDSINRRPGIDLSSFEDEDVLGELLKTFDWVVEEILTS